MGCDGGTIPRRDELVKVKKKAEAKDKHSELVFHWQYCFLTQQLLQSPIVMCGLGHLYNKLALIEALLNKESLPESISHIKNLKDVKNVRLTPNPEYVAGDDKKEGKTEEGAAPYICPVTRIEMSGKFRFVGLWTCGCVFSERALKEISGSICHKCQTPFTSEDVVVLNGTEEDSVLMWHNMEIRQRKNKKSKKKLESTQTTETKSNEIIQECEVSSNTNSNNEIEASSNSSNGIEASSNSSNGIGSEIAGSSGINSKTSSSIPNGILKNKFTKIGNSSSEQKIVGPSKTAESSSKQFKRPGALVESQDHKKKMRNTYSVAKDPQVSDVYKSLFTSHKSEKEQDRAHWITYNPFYN